MITLICVYLRVSVFICGKNLTNDDNREFDNITLIQCNRTRCNNIKKKYSLICFAFFLIIIINIIITNVQKTPPQTAYRSLDLIDGARLSKAQLPGENIELYEGSKLVKAIAPKTASDGIFEWTPDKPILQNSVVRVTSLEHKDIFGTLRLN
ncbi:hypothetical protein [Argonema galeatum]|uniref:hypothetical protein n=1 Tax=Argonema galeatum TaxID=2942762 RepID=UPI002011CB5A|nr:hypothetical protein [Argonema galeatum]MCL1463605.1 hypothetical protein [Argonema galeatum A003/A1]